MFKKHIVVLLVATSAVALSPLRASNCSAARINADELYMRNIMAVLDAVISSRTKSLSATNGKYANSNPSQIALLRTLAEGVMDEAAEKCFLELIEILEKELKAESALTQRSQKLK